LLLLSSSSLPLGRPASKIRLIFSKRLGQTIPLAFTGRVVVAAHEIMSSDDSLKSLSVDYLNLLINGQAFSDVAFSVEGRLVHAHRCVLAARSLFFRKLFCGLDPNHQPPPPPSPASSRGGGGAPATPELVIPVSSIRYEVLVLVLQFLYSGQASVAAPKSGPLPGCGTRGCWHTRCGAAVDLALDTLAAARSFGVEQLALLVQVGISVTFLGSATNLYRCD
jgi:regulatory protein NPR1